VLARSALQKSHIKPAEFVEVLLITMFSLKQLLAGIEKLEVGP
jgi:hypothetical protein